MELESPALLIMQAERPDDIRLSLEQDDHIAWEMGEGTPLSAADGAEPVIALATDAGMWSVIVHTGGSFTGKPLRVSVFIHGQAESSATLGTAEVVDTDAADGEGVDLSTSSE
ncbi:hypothetical protein DBR33_02830 [Stenotrophomonas sp. HMWF022]|nr:hypothetical protein DBR20_15065 [Stenotrophomonas sp. HMWF023]PTT56043.1 hypothetical protein DBR33_02830 [Stenotrophomonas sp. HMWF022]